MYGQNDFSIRKTDRLDSLKYRVGKWVQNTEGTWESELFGLFKSKKSATGAINSEIKRLNRNAQ